MATFRLSEELDERILMDDRSAGITEGMSMAEEKLGFLQRATNFFGSCRKRSEVNR